MIHYIAEWLHCYVMHFGAITAFALTASIYKDGLPKTSEVFSNLKSAMMMAAIIAIFSSFSHAHYLSHFGK